MICCGQFFQKGFAGMICPIFRADVSSCQKIFHVKNRITHLIFSLPYSSGGNAFYQDWAIPTARPAHRFLGDTIESYSIVCVDGNPGKAGRPRIFANIRRLDFAVRLGKKNKDDWQIELRSESKNLFPDMFRQLCLVSVGDHNIALLLRLQSKGCAHRHI